MNLLHSPRKEHNEMEFRQKNSEKKFGELESETFARSKFSPDTSVTIVYQ